MSRIAWEPILETAKAIVDSYTSAISLRQLHYRLVSTPAVGYPNSDVAYKRLSTLTAQRRRNEEFPALKDLTRTITEYAAWSGLASYLSDAPRLYRRDRAEGQDVIPVIIAEKATLLTQLDDWFSSFGIPVIAIRGYSSESLERQMAERFDDGSDYAAIYVGDFDPSGEDIERNLQRYVDDYFIDWTKVAITPEIIDTYHLPENPGKTTDTRAKAFAAKYGRLVQVEVEALEPNDLHRLVKSAVDAYWDHDAYQRVLATERAEREELQRLVDEIARPD